MCLATRANDETWTSSKHISVLEAPLFGATVVVEVSAAGATVSAPPSTGLLATFLTGASFLETSTFELTSGAAACA